MQSDEEIKKIVEAAFRPLRCGADFFDYQEKFKFRVFDLDGKGIFSIADIPGDTVRDEGKLRNILEDTRRRVEEKGFNLQP